ncbi:unnamed protein product [Rotaria magnacalcarata]|uniref:Uncharacterized protein n=1 Tax=Rotaria magnacalcarata TaxID=392030 RepID=A0A815B0C6_9BILA|nr:unnamed protein product [Rotaria magnacalcarata]CAF1677034.1 unnamed protein product [Rotaria magnacalcarata]
MYEVVTLWICEEANKHHCREWRLLLEQQLHSTATNEHERLIKEKIEELQAAEHEWKPATKNSQQRIGIIELLSRFKTLETNLLASSYDDLLQQQVNKYNHYRQLGDDLDEEHTAWLKNTKMIAPIVERFRMLYNQLCFILTLFCLEELYDHVYELDNN